MDVIIIWCILLLLPIDFDIDFGDEISWAACVAPYVLICIDIEQYITIGMRSGLFI